MYYTNVLSTLSDKQFYLEAKVNLKQRFEQKK
jgi:hypothetical protein